MVLSFQAIRILERFHNAIQIQGQRLDEFRARLHELCRDDNRVATEEDFVCAAAAAAGDGGILLAEEAGVLFKSLITTSSASATCDDSAAIPLVEVRNFCGFSTAVSNPKHLIPVAYRWQRRVTAWRSVVRQWEGDQEVFLSSEFQPYLIIQLEVCERFFRGAR